MDVVKRKRETDRPVDWKVKIGKEGREKRDRHRERERQRERQRETERDRERESDRNMEANEKMISTWVKNHDWTLRQTCQKGKK